MRPHCAVPSTFVCAVSYEPCIFGYDAGCDAATGTRPVSKEETCDYDDQQLSGRLVTHLPRIVEDDYPFPCPPGSLGGEDPAHQVSSSCAGPCPSGSFCEAGTMTPEECPMFSYCPLAAAAPTACPPATYGARVGLSAPEECTGCPKGSYCFAGVRVLCPSGMHGTDVAQSERWTERSACTPCPDAATSEAGATARDQCFCIAGYFTESTAETCTQCPIGSTCTAPRTMLSALPLEQRIFRISNASSDLRRCPTSSCMGGVNSITGTNCREGTGAHLPSPPPVPAQLQLVMWTDK